MPILNQKDQEQIKKYNDFIDTYPNASLMQTMEWNKVKDNWQAEYVYIEENENIIAACSILIRKFLNKTIMYAPRGPVCDINNIELINKLTKEIDILAKQKKAILFRFDPEATYTDELNILYKNNNFKTRNKNIDINDTIQPRYNMILDLNNKDWETILKEIHQNARYNIKYALKHNVEMHESHSKEDIDILHELYKTTNIRQKITGRPIEYFYHLLEAFDENKLRLFIATNEGEPLSAGLCIIHGGKCFYIYGASSDNKRNLNANYLVQKNMIEWALKNNCTNYDMGGVFDISLDNGLYQFKRKFCGTDAIEYIGEIDKVYNKSYYFIFNTLVPIYQKTRKRIKKLITK